MRLMKVIHNRHCIGSCKHFCRRDIIVICVYVADEQERIEVDSLPFADFLYRVFSKTKTYAEAGQHIQKLEVHLDQVRQLHELRKDYALYLCCHNEIFFSKLMFMHECQRKRRAIR